MNAPRRSGMLDAVWEVVVRRAQDRATATAQLCEHALHLEGDVRRRDDDLLVGTRVLNRDRELLARLSQATGFGIAVYLGNRRVATATVVDAGTAPDTGGFAPAAYIDRVLRQREVYRGSVDYDNREYLVSCLPLYATGSKEAAPIGMIEAFQDKHAHIDLLGATVSAGLEKEFEDVEARTDGMESIIRFIDDVARRLQLLALNGNIIAAQAGEHGRSFRVVCRELGSVAVQAKGAGAEVRRLIQAMGLEREAEAAPGRRNPRNGPTG